MLKLDNLTRVPDDFKSVAFRKPMEVGRFSLDAHHHFCHDRHQMRCFKLPSKINGEPFLLDLNDGYGTERYIRKDEDIKYRLDSLLQWMLVNKHRFVSKTSISNQQSQGDNMVGCMPDFVLWRGHLTKLMCTPYETRDGWMFAVQKFHDTIYISEVETEVARTKRKNRSRQDDLMMYWGLRFEGYVTTPFVKSEADHCPLEHIVNTNEQFGTVLRSRLGRVCLMYGAEVDCCKPVETLNAPDCYVELKTSREFSSQRQEDNFYRFKALKWWAQSYLAGIPQITCGFRDDTGHVTTIRDFSTLDLPSRAGKVSRSWSSDVCLFFLHNLLLTISRLFATVGDVETVCLLSWQPGDHEVALDWTNDAKHRFLRDWYLQKIVN